MPEKAIIDTSVLIALERINIIGVLCRIYSHIILLKAESLALIDSAYDKAKELRDKGFYISDQLLNDSSRYKKTS
jgi:predicted nucleic acid-binding protein